jgi:steroid 5-alpha reductase family enzyme
VWSEVFLWNALTIASAMLVLWLISIAKRDVSIVDLFWGTGFVVVAWVSMLGADRWDGRILLLAVLVTVWGLRLSGYLAWRNWGKPEDRRYAEMRKKHGAWFPLVSLFTVFGLQGVLMWLIALPVQVGMASAESWTAAVPAGVGLWMAGMFFETVGDFQLARFKSNPENQGEVMDQGLWRYSRHPNYFGDFLVWWGLYLVAAESASWWWTCIGPILMSVLLMKVSGVSLLEKDLRQRKPGYEEYVRTTSAFWPWPPKHEPASG